MRILLTNDDGIASPYLAVLCSAAAARGHQVFVSAPAQKQSGQSHAFTLCSPLLVCTAAMPGAEGAWAVEGTPVDSCRLGFMKLCGARPDLVISGINIGYNAGLAVYVSGTVGAAREAAFQGIPAIAASMAENAPAKAVHTFAAEVVRLGEALVACPLPFGTVCNVNAPASLIKQEVEWVLCPLSHSVYRDDYEERISPRGDRYFWLQLEKEPERPTPGCDVERLAAGQHTITLLSPGGDDQAPFVKWMEKLQETLFQGGI